VNAWSVTSWRHISTQICRACSVIINSQQDLATLYIMSRED
jgi:hypothetical protein